MEEKQLIYQKSAPGRTGYMLPATVAGDDNILAAIPDRFRRSADTALPEVAEPEVMRHYIALSVKNHHIDKGFYPLGSCTMKYNPKHNEVAASYPGFTGVHPLTPCHAANGSLRLMWELMEFLKEISGFAAVSLQPVAGAHGEYCGLLIMRAYHRERGGNRHKIIIPDSAHGTNPASVTAVGFETVQIASNADGIVTPEAVAAAMADDIAGIMLTNPNTLGLFESNIAEIAEVVHKGGGLMYMDGANLNANLGVFRPGDIGFDIMHFNLHKTFSTPHGGGGPGAGGVGVTAALEKYLPFPVLEKNPGGKLFFNYERPHSIGRLHGYFGNFANMVRAYSYIRTLGGKGLREVSENAVLNANYLKALVEPNYDLPHKRHCMHEFVISGNRQKKLGVKTSDVSKRLLDFGVHAPTNYFPLIVPEAMMIEPTETETRETLEQFAEVMATIAREAETNPDVVTSAPHNTPVRRLDESLAARNLDVNFVE